MHFDLQIVQKNGDTLTQRVYQDKPEIRFSVPVKQDVSAVSFDPEEWLLKKVSLCKVPYLPTFDDNFLVIPDQFNNDITIQFKTTVKKARIRLMDLNGKVFFNKKVKKTIELKIATSDLMSGVYLLYITSGYKTCIRRLTKI
jgi:hypothetical protein